MMPKQPMQVTEADRLALAILPQRRWFSWRELLLKNPLYRLKRLETRGLVQQRYRTKDGRMFKVEKGQ